MNTTVVPFIFQDPLKNSESQTYWAQAQEGRLMLKHCKACDTTHYYPRSYCPHCGSDKTEWLTAKGWGEVYTFTRMVRGVDTPYLMAYVLLDEGVHVLTHLQAPNWTDVHIGMRVKVNFSASLSGQSIPFFVPA